MSREGRLGQDIGGYPLALAEATLEHRGRLTGDRAMHSPLKSIKHWLIRSFSIYFSDWCSNSYSVVEG